MVIHSFVGGQTSNTYTDATQASMIRVIGFGHSPERCTIVIAITGINFLDNDEMAKTSAIATYE